jgi:hypothetical protein
VRRRARIVQAARKITKDVPIFGAPSTPIAEAFFRRHDMLLPR